jgi:hypothetical protein
MATTTLNKTNEMSMTPEQILYIKRMQMLHFQKALLNQMSINKTVNPQAVCNVQSTNTTNVDIKYKTELCKTFSQKGTCAYGAKCRFAHGKSELCSKEVGGKKYKLKECASFYTNGTCCYGSRCHFKHEERKINEVDRQYYTYLNSLISTYFTEEASVDDLSALISGIGKNIKMSNIMDEKLPFLRKASVDSHMSDCNTSTSSEGAISKSNVSRFAFAQ